MRVIALFHFEVLNIHCLYFENLKLLEKLEVLYQEPFFPELFETKLLT